MLKSVDLSLKKVNTQISEEMILSKIHERDQAKKNGNYNLADKIRADLSKEGIDIKDEKGTTTWNYTMSKEKIYIFDTTLRDGAQTEGS